MLTSQKLAIAAHLHVLLRRKTGRVTDTEWMAENLEYAMEIVRFTRAKAVEDNHPDLNEWADKLERMVTQPVTVRRPLAQSALQLLQDRHIAAPAPAAPPASGFGQSSLGGSGFADSSGLADRSAKPDDPDVPRYVGGIR